jgi:mRNA-degrading endonuclease toxin of MazEF toxin-antitoxin module
MISSTRGDVILVDIAFSGTIGYKRRPAVVISGDAFNRAGIKLVVAAITSNTLPPYRPGDTLLTDWSAAGLVQSSAVRGVLATVDKADVVRSLGSLSARDMTQVDRGIAILLGWPGWGNKDAESLQASPSRS